MISFNQILLWRLVVLCAAYLFAATPTAYAKSVAKKQEPLPIETMRAAIYTKEFADRFALPPPEPGTEPLDGIQALEFGMHLVRGGNMGYGCDLVLYFDNTLPIAWPEASRASVIAIPSQDTLLISSKMPQERYMKISETDRKHMGARAMEYVLLARLVTSDFESQKRGGSLDAEWHEYDRERFPGVAYAKLSIGCSMTAGMLESFLKYGKGIQLWMKRAGAKDYKKYMGVNPDDFIKVALPLNFIERVLPWVKVGQDYNRIEREDRWRLNRERVAREAAKRLEANDRELRDPEQAKQLLEVMKRMDESAQGRR